MCIYAVIHYLCAVLRRIPSSTDAHKHAYAYSTDHARSPYVISLRAHGSISSMKAKSAAHATHQAQVCFCASLCMNVCVSGTHCVHHGLYDAVHSTHPCQRSLPSRQCFLAQVHNASYCSFTCDAIMKACQMHTQAPVCTLHVDCIIDVCVYLSMQVKSVR
jgi:hypothetical protein